MGPRNGYILDAKKTRDRKSVFDGLNASARGRGGVPTSHPDTKLAPGASKMGREGEGGTGPYREITKVEHTKDNLGPGYRGSPIEDPRLRVASK